MGEVIGLIQTTVNETEQRGHAGQAFTFTHLDEGVANNASSDTLIVTDGFQSHLTFSAAGGGDIYVEIFEDAITSSTGSGLSMFNVNRNSILTPKSQAFHLPTITSTGTLLKKIFVPGGSGGRSSGSIGAGPVRDGAEIILKKYTNYLIRITNKSGQAKTISGDFILYERNIVL
jgi:hypothetical protein